MSTHLIRLIPADPQWVPDTAAVEQARAVLGKLFPGQEAEADT